MTRDPVCGMEVDKNKAVASLVYKNQTYYFCTQRCKQAFEKKPDKYIATQTSEHEGERTG